MVRKVPEQKQVFHQRDARLAGKSNFILRELQSLAVDGIIDPSVTPSRLSTGVGIAILMTTLVLIGTYAGISLMDGAKWQAGFTTLVIPTLASQSLNAVIFEILGEYQGWDYRQVKHRSQMIIDGSIEPSPSCHSRMIRHLLGIESLRSDPLRQELRAGRHCCPGEWHLQATIQPATTDAGCLPT